MVKTMYQQFVEGLQAKVVEYGFANNDTSKNHRYYKYMDADSKHTMTVFINTAMQFPVKDFSSLIATNVIKIERLEFKELVPMKLKHQ